MADGHHQASNHFHKNCLSYLKAQNGGKRGQGKSKFFREFLGTPTAFKSISPRLRRRRYLGSEEEGNDNPDGVVSKRLTEATQPFQGWWNLLGKPGVGANANPGLKDGTPLAFCLVDQSSPEIRE
jgi:hypothetical protein